MQIIAHKAKQRSHWNIRDYCPGAFDLSNSPTKGISSCIISRIQFSI